MMLTGRWRGAIPRHQIHEEMNSELTKVMESNGAKSGDDPDKDKVERPLACMDDIRRLMNAVE